MAAKGPYRDRRVSWRGVLEAWRASGLSRRDSCASRGLALWQFHYWHTRLIGKAGSGAKRPSRRDPAGAPPVFAPVTLATPAKVAKPAKGGVATGVRSRLGCLEVVLDPGFDETTLVRLLRVLQEQGPC